MILVTGATGLVGGHLLWHLLQRHDAVIAIRRESSDVKSLQKIFRFYTENSGEYLSKIEWRIADLLDKKSLEQAMSGVKQIYHCAALVSLSESSEKLLQTNIQGTKNIVDVALTFPVEKLCFVSSIASCQKCKGGNFIDEKGIWQDFASRTDYSRSKYYSEQEVWKGIEKGLKAVIVNPGVILGVSGSVQGSAQIFEQVKKGLFFYTKGGSAYVDVRDVAKIMILLMESSICSERYIIIAENCSNEKILSDIADGLGKNRPKINVGYKLLWLVGFFLEIVGKLFRFTPLISRKSAKTMTEREYYSNKKIKETLDISFIPISKSIEDICRFLMSDI
jgi:nucleoside-diphosphate-sugar epimerase